MNSNMRLGFSTVIIGMFLAATSMSIPAIAKSHKKGAKKVSNPVVIIDTSMGKIDVELNPAKAPKTVENFLKYVHAGFYSGTIFHRVIKGFMIQGGGLDEQMNEKETRPPIKNEADNGLKNEKYTIAMARTSVVDSATAQFFINTADNAFLNFRSKNPQGYGYAVFGKVISGEKVVDKIEAVATADKNGMQDVPVTPVVIKSITLKKD